MPHTRRITFAHPLRAGKHLAFGVPDHSILAIVQMPVTPEGGARPVVNFKLALDNSAALLGSDLEPALLLPAHAAA